MSDNTKIENPSPELKDDALDAVAGGVVILPPEYDVFFAGLSRPLT